MGTYMTQSLCLALGPLLGTTSTQTKAEAGAEMLGLMDGVRDGGQGG